LKVGEGTTVAATFVGMLRVVDVATLPAGTGWLGDLGVNTVFAVGTSGKVYTSWDQKTGGWFDIGGNMERVEAIRDPHGEAALFAVGRGGGIWTTRELRQPLGGWSGWTDISGPPEVPSPLDRRFVADVAVERNPNGGLAVFVLAGGRIWQAWQTQVGGAWQGWLDISPYYLAGRITSITTSEYPGGGLYVAALADSHLWHSWQNEPNGEWGGWLDMTSSAHVPTTILTPVSSIAATPNPGGGVALFAIGGDGNVWLAWQKERKRGWSGWANLGSQQYVSRRLPAPATEVVAGTNFEAGLTVFTIGSTGGVWYARRPGSDGPWVGWNSLGGSPRNLALRASSWEIDGFHLFGISGSQTVVTTGQVTPDSGWTDWRELWSVRP
jgi:hypothetical protein